MKTNLFVCRLFKLVLWLALVSCVFQAQAQRVEMDNLTWFDVNDPKGMPPGTYTKPGSPSETIVDTIPLGGPPAVFCRGYGTELANNGQTVVARAYKGYFQTLNDYGGTFTFTRRYLVTPGKGTYIKVRMATHTAFNLRVSNIAATIDGRSLGGASRFNSSWENQAFFESSQFWTPTSSLVDLVISVTMPGGCHSDEQFLIIDQFYQEGSTIHAVDDSGSTLDSNGGQSVANVLANDVLGSATATLSSVILTPVSSTDPQVSLDTNTGAVHVAPGTQPGNYSLVYRICERANPSNCSQATVSLRVNIAEATITVKKALAGGGRLNPADQFTVQLKYQWNGKVYAAGTTKGSGTAVDAGSGTTGAILSDTADNGATYLLGEEMAAGSVSSLSRYSSLVACENKGIGGTDVSQIRSFSDVIAPNQGDTIICTITNRSPGATLRLKQVIAPGSGQPPFSFDYGVGNGWGNTTLNSTATGTPGVSSDTRAVATIDTATPISVTLPAGWRIVPEDSSCVDSNGAASGNGSTRFGTLASNTLTVAAANVRTGSALECTVTLAPAAALPTLTVRHMVISPVPVNVRPPFQFSYTGDNGWSAPALQLTALNRFASTAAIPLAAANTATSVSTHLPDARWFVASFGCRDTTAAASGNAPGTLVTSNSPNITIPAALVVPNANLLCSMLMGRQTP